LFNASKGRTSRAFIDEIEQWTNEEIDFRREARNGHRMWLFSKDDPDHVDAKIVFEYSTSRILTTEFMDGIPLIDIIKAVHNSDDKYLDDLAHRGYDRAKIARRIGWNLFNQLFRDQFFHADLHPGNIFVLPGNVIGYIDFGISSQLSPELKTSLQNYVRHVVDGNIDQAVGELMRWLTPAPTTNLDHFRQDFAALLEEYRFGTGDSSNSLKLTSELIVRNMSLMRQHRLVASRGLNLYFKAVLTADSVVLKVEPGYKLFDDIKLFFATAQRDDIRDMLSGIRIPQLLVNSTYQVNQLVAAVSRTQSSGRSFEVWLETLQTRLAMYGFLAITLAIISYAVYNSALVNSAGRLFGVTLSSALLLGVVVLLIVMWRRGRELTTVDRRPMERGGQDGLS
jgi:ubiquinone biosynthesis protein